MSSLTGKEKKLDEERKARQEARTKGMKIRKVDWKEFVIEWMAMYDAGGNMLDLAKKLDLPYTTITARRDKMRHTGVALPDMKSANFSVSGLALKDLKAIVAAGVTGEPRKLKKAPV